jgi:DNA polymerase-3 subunit epsilon
MAYAAAPLPRGRSDWREAAWAVVDLETTGLDPARDEVIAFAVVPVDGAAIRPGAAAHGLVRPARMPEAGSIRIHGIRPADLAHAPSPQVARDALLEALTGRLLVAHAAQVERGFLAPLLDGAGVTLRGPVADTRELGRAWLAETRPGTVAPRLALDELARRLGLPVHRPHHALGDALTTAQVFLALATRLQHRGRLSVRSLIAAQQHAGHQRG